MRIAYRLHTPLSLVAPVLAVALTTIAVTRGGTAMLAVSGVAALALVAVVVSLKPEHVFLFWLVAAPFLQDVGSGRLQHVVRIALYSAPPLFFFAWSMLQRRAIRGSVVDLFPAAYVAYAVGSALVAGVNVSATQVFAIVVTGVIVYYFCAFCSLGGAIERQVAAVVLLTTIVVSLVVVIGKLAGQSFGDYSVDYNAHVQRATGTFRSPALFGAFVGVGFALALAVLVWKGPPSLRPLALICVLVGPPALFLSLTRGPMIAAGAVGVLILLSRARTRWPGVLAGIVVALVVAGLWGPITATSLYKDRFSNQSNVQERVLLNRWSLELAARKPVLGWGYGSFDQVKNTSNLSSAGSVPRSELLFYTSHNTFLTILVELGGVGLVLLLVPWLVVVKSSFRLLAGQSSTAWLAVGLLGALGVWVINAGTVDLRFFSLAWVLPWLALGLLRRMALDDEQRRSLDVAA